MMRKYIVHNGQNLEVEILEISPFQVKFKFESEVYTVANLGDVYSMGEEFFKVKIDEDEVSVNGQSSDLKALITKRTNTKKSLKGDMLSPMPGKILKINVNEGQSFKVGEPLVVMEAMKMEHTIKATVDGILKKNLVSVGQTIQGGIHLFEYEKV